MRVWHRYLGFFLSGIMAIYALSGVIMIFRDTDFLRVEVLVERELDPGLNAEALGRALRQRRFEATRETESEIVFAEGRYDKQTGLAAYTRKELPLVLKKLTQMHKASTDRPLFFFNVFFGFCVLFFVVSAFFMFMPTSPIFRKGLYFVLAGLGLATAMVYF